MTHRSGWAHADCITLIVISDELDAMLESVGVAASISANNLILKSGRSGAFSLRKSARGKLRRPARADDRRWRSTVPPYSLFKTAQDHTSSPCRPTHLCGLTRVS